MKIGYAILAAAILGLPLLGCGKDDPQGFPKVDYNKDGKVIFEELIVAFPDLTVDEFLAADADRNGSISEQEFKTFRAARKAGKKLEVESQKPADTARKPMTEPLGQAAPEKASAAPAASSSATPDAAEKAPAATPVTPEAAPAASAPAATTGTGDLGGAPAATPASPAGAEGGAPAPGTEAVAVPAPSATPAPTAATPEPVETVEVPTAKPAPVAATTTYTVQRGDSLSRIAKKCGVSVKDLMAANGMKDADHLQAGASLVIPAKAGATNAPAPAGVPAPPEVTRFVTEYFTKDASGDINGLIDLYNTTVEYHGKARTGSDVVRQDKAELFLLWPKRSYTPGAITSESLPDGEVRVTAPAAYTFAKGDKKQQGDIRYTLVLRPHGGGYHIVAEQRSLTIKK